MLFSKKIAPPKVLVRRSDDMRRRSDDKTNLRKPVLREFQIFSILKMANKLCPITLTFMRNQNFDKHCHRKIHNMNFEDPKKLINFRGTAKLHNSLISKLEFWVMTN